jgi:SsrA-binding protein
VRRNEVRRLSAAIQREGLTLIPLRLYFNPKGVAKVELGIARGRKMHDKRQAEKARDWQRDKARLLRVKS